jgi:hypothetical protein
MYNYYDVQNNLKEEITTWCVQKNKIPFNPRSQGNKRVQTNDITTFSDFDTAYKAYQEYEYDSLGIGLFNGISAIDIDNCIDENGVFSKMAQDIINKIDSYTEYSPSGKGVHIIFKTTNFNYDVDKYYINHQKIGLEVYISDVTSKYVTFTGNVIKDKPITDCTDKLFEILDKYMKRAIKSISKNTLINTQCDFKSDNDYLKIGLNKDKKLIEYWNGNRVRNSESEDDLAFFSKLMYWTNNNIDLAIKAFKSSPYSVQKDDKHKKKLERNDYLMRTANTAIQSSTAREDNTKWKIQNTQMPINDNDKLKPYIVKEIQPSKTLKIISAKELQQTELEPTKFLVEDILPEGTSMISASPKTGKSWFVLQMGLCIATGNKFLGKETHKSGVLYLALEDSNNRLQSRTNKILDSNDAPSNFYFCNDVPTLDNGFIEFVNNAIDTYPDIKLIIIDTLQLIRGQSQSKNSAYQQDYNEMHKLKSLFDSKNVSALFVHHNRKMKDSDPFNMISGTNGIMGAFDTIYTIIKSIRNSSDATLHITGKDIDSASFEINFNKSNCTWGLVGDTKKLLEEKERNEYVNNKIANTIYNLLIKNPNNTWEGRAIDLFEAGNKIMNCDISKNTQSLAYELKNLQPLLKKYGNIIYTIVERKGNNSNLHHFEFDKK